MYKSKSYLQLVTVEVTGDDQTFGADNNDLLTLEEALGNGGGKATHKVTITIDDFDSVKSVRHIQFWKSDLRSKIDG